MAPPQQVAPPAAAPVKKRKVTVPPPLLAPPAPVDTTADQLLLIGQARDALRDKKPAQALEALDAFDKRFGTQAQLGDEARAIRVLALCTAGRFDEGRAGLARIEAELPGSPYLARLRAACR